MERRVEGKRKEVMDVQLPRSGHSYIHCAMRYQPALVPIFPTFAELRPCY